MWKRQERALVEVAGWGRLIGAYAISAHEPGDAPCGPRAESQKCSKKGPAVRGQQARP